MIKELISSEIKKVLESLDTQVDFSVEYPADLKFGDYSSNVAMVLAKSAEKNPVEIAQKIATILQANLPAEIEKVTVAGPGFINFYINKNFITQKIHEVFLAGNHFGRGKKLSGQKIIIEYTDPNPFKQFHIGHLMANSIGEAVSRLFDWSGAEVFRLCYQGDVGLHVAKAIWGMIQNKAAFPHDTDSLKDKMKFLGEAYSFGAEKYEDDEIAKNEIHEINKKVFNFFNGDPNDDDQEIKIYYEKGKSWSLAHFDEVYAKLGTKFDKFIYESTTAALGEKIVRENIRDLNDPNSTGVFELSDGAIVYKGEQDGLHTRVFINSQGLPSYEAKEIGLAYMKEKIDSFDQSVVVTASEQKEYFKVVMAALAKIDPELSLKTKHITHGMMMLPEGKMSSRKGKVITGETLMLEAEEMVRKIIAERGFEQEAADKIIVDVAVAAIKYSILKQASGRDIIYNSETAVTFEGDSGPYLQYTVNRAKSIMEKAVIQEIEIAENAELDNWNVTNLERMIVRFPEIVADAAEELAPHKITNYLIQVAGEFNSFYASNQIIDNSPEMSYKLALTKAVQHVLENGLNILGIRVPDRM